MSPTAKIISIKKSDINLKGTPFESLKDKIPQTVNQVMIFDVTECNCELVNALRRTLISEMPVRHLTAALSDIKTTDPYLIGEAVLKRIEMIPISQSTDMKSKFAIRFENVSDTYVDVLSSEIRLNGKDRSKDVLQDIPICDINASTSFTVSDIYVQENYGYNNARVSIGRVGYQMLDQDFSEPSLQAFPTGYRMEIETPGIIDPKEMVLKAIDCLSQRLKDIDYSNAMVEFGIYKLKILNETYSVGHILQYYVMQVDSTVAYCAPRILHPSQRVVVLDIQHPSGEDLCRKAVELALQHLASIRSTFS